MFSLALVSSLSCHYVPPSDRGGYHVESHICNQPHDNLRYVHKGDGRGPVCLCIYKMFTFEEGNDFLGPYNLLLRKDKLWGRANSHDVCFKTIYKVNQQILIILESMSLLLHQYVQLGCYTDE